MPDSNPRFVSRLTRNTLALILADRKAGFHVSDGGITLVTPEMLGQGSNAPR